MFGLVPFGMKKDVSTREQAPQSIFDVFNEPFFHDDFFNGFGLSTMMQGGGMRVDVKDKGDSYELTADLPGLKKEDLSLSYQNGYLTIAANRDESREEKEEDGRYLRRERHAGSVSRSFYIDNIDEAKIDAEFKDGVLHVTLPKTAVVEHPSTINIR